MFIGHPAELGAGIGGRKQLLDIGLGLELRRGGARGGHGAIGGAQAEPCDMEGENGLAAGAAGGPTAGVGEGRVGRSRRSGQEGLPDGRVDGKQGGPGAQKSEAFGSAGAGQGLAGNGEGELRALGMGGGAKEQARCCGGQFHGGSPLGAGWRRMALYAKKRCVSMPFAAEGAGCGG